MQSESPSQKERIADGKVCKQSWAQVDKGLNQIFLSFWHLMYTMHTETYLYNVSHNESLFISTAIYELL